MNIILRLLLPILLSLPLMEVAWAEEPINTLLSAKQIAITSTAPKLNKTTGTWDVYVTIRNKTKPKLKQNFYGPLTLIVNSVSRADVVLVNKTGQMSGGQPYLNVPVVQEGLAAGKTIKRISLQFNNPSKKGFKVKYQVMGYLAPYTPPQVPGVATLIAPTGTINTATPTYTWNRVAGATSYLLRVVDSSGEKIMQTYSAESAGCGSESISKCNIISEKALAEGSVQWWIQASNNQGLGAWSAPQSFTYTAKVNPPPEASCSQDTQASIVLESLTPNEGSSGSAVILNGTCLPRDVTLMLGDVSVKSTRYISEKQIEFTIPFTLDAQNSLTAIPEGIYSVKLGASNALNLKVKPLLVIDGTPGTVLDTVISDLQSGFAEDNQVFQQNLNNLLNELSGQPNTQAFIRKLADLSSLLQSQGQQLVNDSRSQLDENTLKTLDSAFHIIQNVERNRVSADQKVKAQSSSITANSEPSCIDEPDGDAWLKCRANDPRLDPIHPS